jgi:hypothetical protein
LAIVLGLRVADAFDRIQQRNGTLLLFGDEHLPWRERRPAWRGNESGPAAGSVLVAARAQSTGVRVTLPKQLRERHQPT